MHNVLLDEVVLHIKHVSQNALISNCNFESTFWSMNMIENR